MAHQKAQSTIRVTFRPAKIHISNSTSVTHVSRPAGGSLRLKPVSQRECSLLLRAARRVVATIDEIAARTCSTSALLREHAILLARWMEESDFRDGCPITTALLELAPNDRDVTAAGKMAYDTRLERLSSMLVNDGREEQSARRLACLCISVIQGSLIQARVERSGHPIMIAADELARLLEA